MSNTTFSYAQAAKGQTAVQPSPQTAPSPAPPSTSSQGKDDTTTATTTSVTAPSVTSNDSEARDVGKFAQLERESSAKRDPDATSASATLSTASNSFAEQPTQHIRNGDSGSVDSSRSQPRSASQTSRSVDSVDAKKSRKSRKVKGSDKDGEEQDEEKESDTAKPAPLAEAPPPPVNVWQRRIAEAAAKSRASPAASNPAPSAPAVVATEEPKRRSTIESAGPATTAIIEANNDKPQRRSVDFSRPAEQPARRSAPRGSRAVESLPSVADAASWPDPRSAATSDEGKRKAQDKTDKTDKESQDEAAPLKRQKEKWVTMPYVPTVNFQTPIPQRGSKPRGGARGGRDTGARGAHSSPTASGNPIAAGPASENAPAAAVAPAGKENRPRDSSGATRPTSLPPSTTTKRSPADSGYTREVRKPSAATSAERPKDATAGNASAVSIPGNAYKKPFSKTSAAVQSGGTAKGENTRPNRSEFAHANNEQAHYPTRAGFSDRRVDSGPKAFDTLKEGAYSGPKDSSYPVRERGEGRGDRGRGGFRGRGGHNNSLNSHPQMSGFQSTGQYPVQLPSSQHAPYSPPAHQNTFGSAFGAGPTRGGGRGRANQGSNSFSRTTSNGAGSASKMPPVNTNIAGFDYPIHQFSTYSFQAPFYDPSTLQLLMLQVEYYLSVDNLCKDFFIRKRMDSKGFVPLSVIANFNRMRDLAPDNDAIRLACELSEKLDYIVGDDNIERLRLRDRWDRFVLGPEEREEEARIESPNHWAWRSKHSRPPYTAPMMMPGYPAASPTVFPGTFSADDQAYPPHYVNGTHFEPSANGAKANGHRYGADSQLSAAVPEFSPSAPVPFTLEGINVFSDQQVEALKVLISLDGKKGTSHVETPAANGSAAPPNGGIVIARSDSINAPKPEGAKEPRSPSGSNPNVIWAKEHRGDASESYEEPYPIFRKKALEQRRDSKPGETPRAMKNLYEFWSHFLVGRFNAKMYEEFRRHAMEDASRENPAKDGLKYLIHYYNQLFAPDSPKPWGNNRQIPEIFNLHSREAFILSPPTNTNGDAAM